MTDALALTGGPPSVRPQDLPTAWPYWSAPPSVDVHASFTAWPTPEIAEVEAWVKGLHDVRHSLYVNSGTSALWMAYFALGLSPGDEVLVPTNTFLATVTPLFQLNLVPVLCDSSAQTGCLDLEKAQRRLTPRTRAICVTHLWGTPMNLAALYSWAADRDLDVVEDCSHAHGARSDGRPVGSGATVAALSLGASKTVSGGVGGAFLTSSQEAYERALLLGMPPRRLKREVRLPQHKGLEATGLGANLRGHPHAAALALDHVRRFPEIVERKNANLLRLENAIAASSVLEPPPRPEHWTGGTRYGFKASTVPDGPSAEALVAALQAEGVPTRGAAGPLLHRRRLFLDPGAITTYAPGRPLAEVTCDPEDYPVSDRIQATMVSFDATLLHDECDALLAGVERALEKVERDVDLVRRHGRRADV